MSLSDDIRGFRENWAPRQGPSCKVGLLIEMIPDEDRPVFVELLGSQIYGTDIAKMVNGWSTREGLSSSFRNLARSVRGDNIQRHRRGACMCERNKAS